MLYLTEMLNRPVLHPDGERFGRIVEVVVTPAEPLPVIAAYQVRTNDGAVFVPTAELPLVEGKRELVLHRPLHEITQHRIEPQDFSLVRDVLDKQIVDVHDYRVVRVNDIALEPLPDGRLSLFGVDAGVRGLLRRLGVDRTVDRIGRFFKPGHEGREAQIIAWQDVESLPTHNAGAPLRLKVSYEKLAKLHPADIGEILNQMPPSNRKEVLETLDVEAAAEALAEADEDVQIAALQNMDEERAADILEEMPADEAADVLGNMDAAHREDLLDRMEADDREAVEELLPYGDRTAGGLMTKEFVAIPQDFTAQQTIDRLRELEPEAETIYYVYVEDRDEKLVGVISLRDLIISKPEALITDFMIRNVIRINDDARVEEIARTFEKYGLLAIPVVDEADTMLGIVTIDDTLEQLLPPGWRRPGRRSGATTSE